jgi:type II secretory pathway predicted ATPase ExeA
MTLARFNLSSRPFATGPDPAAYYPAPGHEEALEEIITALADGEPYVLLFGEAGVGKTLVAQLIMSRLGDDTLTALVTNCHFSCRGDLLQAMLYELGLPHVTRPEQEMRIALTEFLLGRHLAGQKTVLVLDEAQLLTPDLLEEVRLLGNLESPKGKAVQVVLIAQPDIFATLELPGLGGFVQRLVARIRLEPLGMKDSAAYLAHQITRAGGKPESVLTDEAIEVLSRGCRGVPRLLNQAGRAAFSVTAKAGLRVVDAEGATEALASLPHAGPLEPEPPPPAVYSDDELVAEGEMEPDEKPIASGEWMPESLKRFEFTPMQ